MSAPPSRRVTLVVGLLMVVAGTAIFLAAANIIPQPDEKFGAPRWMVALSGLAFFFAGWYIVSIGLPAPRMGQVLAGATTLTFLTSMALILTWLARTGGEAGRATISIGPFSLLLPSGIARGIERAIIWFFALVLDAIALFAWYQTARWLLRRRAP